MSDKIVFGTDGIRGHADHAPFTAEALSRLAYAIGRWAVQKYGQTVRVLVGNDTRISCERIKKSLIDGLKNFPLTLVDAGVLPTPAIYQLMVNQEDSYNVGIVISASHNPYYDNGIKLFDAQNCKLNSADEALIMDYCNTQYFQQDDKHNVSTQGECVVLNNAEQTYEQILQKQFPHNFLSGLKIVLDCAHGATYRVAPNIFRLLGAEVILVGAEPTGININDHVGALHPEALQKIVVEQGAHLGFAFDGDGDRVLAVAADGSIKDGDDILALLLKLPMYQHLDAVVGTIMTNRGFEVELINQQRKLIRTSVGDKYVVASMEECNLLLGGESSGHIILKNYLPTGDGIFVALKVIESIIVNQNWAMQTFKKFHQVLINVPVFCKQDLSTAPYDTIIMEHKQAIQDGRIVVRYSGTENLLRVMTEADGYDDAYTVAHSLASKLQQSLARVTEGVR